MEMFIRKERTHLFAPSINIAVVSQFEGKIREDGLYFAIKNAMRHNEILCSKIKLDTSGKAFFEMPSEPCYRFETMAGDWRSLIKEQERIPFDLEHGEYIRFFFSENKWGTLLIFIAHHVIGDGLSMTYFMEDILKSLNGYDLDYKPMKQFPFETIPKAAKLHAGMKFALNLTNKRWEKTGKIFQLCDYETLCKDFWKKKVTGILYEQIEKEQFLKLKELCNNHGITLNSLLTAVFLKAQNKQINLGITVNIREKENHSMGNYATGISISYIYNEEKDFWENAKIVHDTIYQKLNNEKEKYFLVEYLAHVSPTLIDGAYFAAFEAYENKIAKTTADMFGYQLNPTSMNISNLTCIHLNDEEEKYHLKEFFILPPLPANAKSMVGISTFHDNMTITYHFAEELDVSIEEKIFKRAIEELQELI